jgi:hypothetical protein
MRRLLALALISAAIFPVAAQTAAAEGKNSGDSCGMGSLLSEVTQIVGGLGRVGHQEGGLDNIGNQVIQPLHNTFIKPFCK